MKIEGFVGISSRISTSIPTSTPCFFFKKHKFRKHEAQNTKILRNIQETLPNCNVLKEKLQLAYRKK